VAKDVETLKGVPEGLKYALRWDTPRPTGTAAEATRGSLYVELDRRPVWGDRIRGRPVGIPWTWIDLLEHLTKSWPKFMWEELEPLNLRVPVFRLRAEAQRRWHRRPQENAESEQRALLRFQTAHDLATALGGTDTPSLWVVREGERVILSAAGITRYRPFVEVRATLEALGSEIANRLDAVSDGRGIDARTGWQSRDAVPAETIVALATGLPREQLLLLSGNEQFGEFWGVEGIDPQPTPVLAAARMLGPDAPIAVLRHCLNWIRSVPRRVTVDLDGLATEAVRRVGIVKAKRPFVQGYALAEWFRAIPGIVTDEGRVDPERILKSLSVDVSVDDLGWTDIDAVACWSPDHGPAVRVNSGGRHAQGEAGRRTTIAHELCHLLSDRAASLPLAEVLGGRTPVVPEQRANAFAAELLLPRSIAGAAFPNGSAVEKQTESLKDRYGVSAEVVAWQALRSGLPLRKHVLASLRNYVTDKDAWDVAVKRS
jgi:hypothetical protein